MCGCFVVALGAFFPRIALALLWLFGDTVEKALGSDWIVPLLGLLLLPYTTLSYVLLNWWLGDVTGFTWFFIGLAFLADIGSYASSARARSYGSG